MKNSKVLSVIYEKNEHSHEDQERNEGKHRQELGHSHKHRHEFNHEHETHNHSEIINQLAGIDLLLVRSVGKYFRKT